MVDDGIRIKSEAKYKKYVTLIIHLTDRSLIRKSNFTYWILASDLIEIDFLPIFPVNFWTVI